MGGGSFWGVSVLGQVSSLGDDEEVCDDQYCGCDNFGRGG